MSTVGWIILIVVNVPVCWFLGWIVFKTWEDFWDCVKFWLTPDIISLFLGEWIEDQWAQVKLFLWIALCAGALFGESLLLGQWFN